MNSLAAELTQRFRGNIMEEATVIDFGRQILGSQILSRSNPASAEVLPIGVSRVNYKTEFESMSSPDKI
jgi:hypothetical protein